jgi:hypothetical protein
MRQRPYKILFGRKGIFMNSLGIRRNLTRNGRRRIVQDSIRRGLNTQELRTTGRVLGRAFLLEVCTRRISPPRVEINLLEKPQEILITQRENP